ncbi:class II D-tagatose-bisphosphate aldolase non-catalytic subunit [Celeribacter indicus]|uniref:Tagatose-6-phosphate kinase n=1 Tax=Celeribacter indicus TaxID=1208324 RepID=A0A0B5E5Q3_9RHOB|nr:class II D-tagatose-bisphosphate aldolase, non-catalytic subunit [Celeribacter indicus]AJE48710.1 tagatose-6-phosphate kinase [Celeribacter indicus]SDX12378.1 D-tagatose-1,6-bisphosphate aldolase subunit GatZ/KbaZ [Celeribacter indicus]
MKDHSDSTGFAAGIARNRADEGFAFCSVCSAHPDVLVASLRLARDYGVPMIVEATSNQVNQFGGYTGLKPADFVAMVHALCAANGIEPNGVIFGGDHLGPQAWKHLPADEAMARAEAMMTLYIEAGFTKIHLDCSEGCAGEPRAVNDMVAAARAARLAQVCEAAAKDRSGSISYIVGTEVPPPGGARAGEGEAVAPTPPANAAATIEAHRAAFVAASLDSAWSRVRGLVVQPGLEFAPDHVDRFDIAQPDLLSPVLADHPAICFEAHSTDYQFPEVFKALGRRHFGVLKVGPALTFAYREALYLLSAIDGWITQSPPVSGTMERLMLADPAAWTNHYVGDAQRLQLLRHFGYADRIRYYWTNPEAIEAVKQLEARMDRADIPEPLLAQYLSADARRRVSDLRAQGMSPSKAVIHTRIEAALAPYLEVSR